MIIHNAAITGSLTLNGIDISDITGSEAGVNALNDFSSSILNYTSSTDARINALNVQTSSLLSYTASNDAKITALNAQTASILSYTSSNDAKIAAIYTATSSLNASVSALNLQTASILSYTSSTDAKISSVYNATSSLQSATSSLQAFSSSILSYTSSNDARIAGLNSFSSSILSYTSSTDAKIASIYSTTASLNASVAGLNAQSASLLSYTASNSANISSLFASVSSLSAGSASSAASINALNAQTASLLSYTSSNSANIVTLFTTSASLNANVVGLNTYTSSLNAKTASFATTGSNTFTGQQYISNASQANSFTQTASLYTDGGMRVTKDMYVSGTAYFNNITVFGTQSVAFISSSQLNIATNIISVNTSLPTVRFGGLSVYDSGSTGLTGSMLWDSQDNQWIYTNPSGSEYDSAVFLVGPRSTGAIGNEVGITTNSLSKGNGMHHMTSSAVFEVSGSVGIGTSSPSSTLHLVASAGPVLRLVRTSNRFDLEADNNSMGLVSRDSSTAAFYFSGFGNVGIGTTSPTYILDVFNSTEANLRVKTSSTSGLAGLYIGNGNRDYSIITRNSVSNVLEFRNETANTTVMAISGSNVGIGSTSPGVKLDILGGQARVSGSTNEQLVLDYATASGGFTWQSFRINGTNKYRLVGNVDNSFGIYNDTLSAYALTIASTSAATFANALQVAGQQAAANYGGTGLNFDFTSGNIGRIASVKTTSGGSQLQFFVYNTSGTDINALQITSTGNVGIGTTTPGYKLSIVSTSGAQLELINSATSKSWRPNVDGSDFAITETGVSVPFIIKAGGNVGIGTTNPAVPLQIRDSSVSSGGSAIHAYGFDGAANFYTSRGEDPFNAALYLYNNPSSGQGYGTGIIFRAKSDTTVSQVQGAIYTTWTTATDASRTAKMVFSTVNSGTSSDKVTILGNGNVGIGTTSPAYLLDVNGNGRFTGNVLISKSNDATVEVNSTTAASYSAFFHSESGTAKAYWEYVNSNFSIASRRNYLEAFNSVGGFAVFTAGTKVLDINTSGDVGIGTSSPDNSKLRIRADHQSGYSILSIQPISNNTATMGFYNSSAARKGMVYTTDTSLAIETDGLPIDLSANGNPRVRVTTDGNVGIGTTSPALKLDIQSTGGALGSSVTYPTNTNGIVLRNSLNSANTGSGIWFDHGGLQAGIASARVTTGDWGTDIRFYTHPTTTSDQYIVQERMRIDASGNVGIGTTDPNYKLRVEGTLYSLGAARFNGVVFSDSRLGIGVAGGDQTYASVFVGGALTSGTNQYALLLDPQLAGSGDNYGLFANARIKANTAVNNAFGVYIPSAEKLSGATITNNYALYIANQTSGASLNYSIYSSGGLNYFGGNVGIGTTSPATKLMTIGTIRANGADGQIDSDPSVGAFRFYNGTTFRGGFGTDEWATGGSASNLVTYLNGGNYFIYSTSTSSKIVTVLAGGNVGIGTTSPSAKFNVNNSGGTGNAFYVDAGNNGSTQVLFEHSGANTPVPFSIRKSGYSGTADTFGILHIDMAHNVAGGGSNLHFTLRNSSGNVTEYGGLGAIISTNTAGGEAGALNFYTTNAGSTRQIRMRIAADGNVGIGTTNPYYRLVVNGIVGIENANELVFFDSGNLGSSNLRCVSGGLRISTNGASNAMVLVSDGNVGINSTSPGYKLDVNGTARFGSVIVGSLGTGTVYSNGGTLTNTNPSDRNLKENITPIEYGLSDVLQLNPVSFDWKDGTNGKQFGFIAQEVQEVMPDAIKEGEYLGLEKDAIYASLVNAIKELKAEIDILKNK